jgi:hypothetical protein
MYQLRMDLENFKSKHYNASNSTTRDWTHKISPLNTITRKLVPRPAGLRKNHDLLLPRID